MPEDGLDQLLERDAILLGAVGDPRVPDHLSLWGLLDPEPPHVRPVREPAAGPALPWRPEPPCGPAGTRRGHRAGERRGRVLRGRRARLSRPRVGDGRPGGHLHAARRDAHRRVRVRAGRARRRRGRRAPTKSDGIVHTPPFWDEVVREVAARDPGVDMREEHIDALCAKVVMQPGSFDVVVGSNLFGDILSDLTAGAAGSIGIAPSANLNPEREFPSMFEPVHGSAQDIRGAGHRQPGRDAVVGADDARVRLRPGGGRGSHGRDRGVARGPGHPHARPRRARGHRDRRRGRAHTMPTASIMIGTPMMMRIAPQTSKTTPLRTIRVMGTIPDP